MKQLITCNKRIVDNLLVQGKLPQEYYSKNALNVYDEHREKFPCVKFFYDRTQTIPHYLNVDPLAFPMPELNPTVSNSFYDIAKERALELLATGKRINVAWSGGIDSTFIFFTLYNYANDKSQIKIYATYNSIIESGDLFDRYIKDKVEYDIHTNLEYHENFNVPESELVITGCMGNDLFYPEIKYGLRDSWMLFRSPVEDNIKTYWDHPYQKVLKEENLLFLEKLIAKSPNKIETLQELRFWMSFTCNWYTTNTNRYIGIGPERSKQVFAFFDTAAFQNWAVFNKDPHTKIGDYSDERWQMREYIAQYASTNYSKIKRKHTSVLSNFGQNWLFLLNDYSNVYLDHLQ